MTRRSRILAFGSAAVLVIAGVLCAALISGLFGEVLSIALIGVGLGGAVLLAFLEVGLGEERDLQREEDRRQAQQRRALDPAKRPRLQRRPRRPG